MGFVLGTRCTPPTGRPLLPGFAKTNRPDPWVCAPARSGSAHLERRRCQVHDVVLRLPCLAQKLQKAPRARCVRVSGLRGDGSDMPAVWLALGPRDSHSLQAHFDHVYAMTSVQCLDGCMRPALPLPHGQGTKQCYKDYPKSWRRKSAASDAFTLRPPSFEPCHDTHGRSETPCRCNRRGWFYPYRPVTSACSDGLIGAGAFEVRSGRVVEASASGSTSLRRSERLHSPSQATRRRFRSRLASVQTGSPRCTKP